MAEDEPTCVDQRLFAFRSRASVNTRTYTQARTKDRTRTQVVRHDVCFSKCLCLIRRPEVEDDDDAVASAAAGGGGKQIENKVRSVA